MLQQLTDKMKKKNNTNKSSKLTISLYGETTTVVTIDVVLLVFFAEEILGITCSMKNKSNE